MLLVGLPEESRAIKACPQHSLMAVTHDALRIAGGIQYRQKVRQPFVIALFDCKISLVIARHRYPNFLRKRADCADHAVPPVHALGAVNVIDLAWQPLCQNLKSRSSLLRDFGS